MSAEEWRLMDLVRWTADYFRQHDVPNHHRVCT